MRSEAGLAERGRYCLSETWDVSDVDRDIERWRGVLESAQVNDLRIESQLVRFLLVHVCGRYERVVDELVKERAKKSGDLPLASYVGEAYKPRREPRWQYLQNDVLGKFGGRQREWFMNRVDAATKNKYNSLITNRNESAHGRDVSASISEIAEWHKAAKEILRVFAEALNLPDSHSAQGRADGGERPQRGAPP